MSEVMVEMMNQILEILLPAVATLLAGWLAVVGNKVKTLYTEKVNTQIKKEVVEATVTYVQQVYKALDGDVKLDKAVDRASVILTEKGIPISEAELTMLIEAAVYGLKQGWLNDEPTVLEIEEKNVESENTEN